MKGHSMTYTVQELRKELRAAGYKLRITTYSEFKGGEILKPDGSPVGGVFPAKGFAKYKAEHAVAFDILDKYRGQTFDGEFRVVLS